MSKITRTKCTGGVAQMVECVFYKLKTLVPQKKKKTDEIHIIQLTQVSGMYMHTQFYGHHHNLVPEHSITTKAAPSP
jgi:hypothetical protein